MSNMRHDINKINFSRPFKEQHYQRDCQLLLKRKNSKKKARLFSADKICCTDMKWFTDSGWA